MAEVELQAVFAENRRWFEPTLRQLLSEGDVLAEDYVGTSLAGDDERCFSGGAGCL